MPLTRTDRPYERRRTRPIVVTAAVLAVLVAATWTVVLGTASDGPGSTSCPAPAGGALPGTEITRADLGTAAAPPRDVRFQVLNAGGQRGQANLVSAQLRDLAFGEANAPGNDPAFPDGDLGCIGQLRFGPDGVAAASALTLALPCVELVRDERPGAVVDVVVGTAFTDVAPGRSARDALDQLASPGTEGGAQADPTLLADARESSCGS